MTSVRSLTSLSRVLALSAAACVAFATTGCGSDAKKTASNQAATAEFANVKNYLLEHTEPLADATGTLKEQGAQYYALAKAADFDYDKLLDQNRPEVKRLVEAMQATWRKANPLYEEAEGVVAGVPELADYDVILDAGSSAKEDAEGAVPFDLKLPNGKVEKQPGNLFFLTETSLWGTQDAFVAAGMKPDLDGDGKVQFGEALPEANHIAAATADFKKYADELNASSQAWSPTKEDVFTALVVMTPTMAEYFEAWKNSRFVAGSKATEASFVGSSRLNDITDILSGLVLVYENVEPLINGVSAAQAKQTADDLTGLRDFAADLRDREKNGEKFTAAQAETLGAEAQGRAERIAGQVSQAAAKLEVTIES